METITPDNPMMTPLAENTRNLGINTDNSCAKAVELDLKTLNECDAAKQEIIVQEIERSSAGNKACMKVLAEGIEDGSIPIAEGGADAAWDPENPFRNLDAANKEVPEPKAPEPVDPELLTPEQKEIEKLKEELGSPLEIPPPPANSDIRPTLEEIGKACNTF